MARDPADKLMNLAIDGEDDIDEVEVVEDDGEVVEETVTTTEVRHPAVRKTTTIIEEES